MYSRELPQPPDDTLIVAVDTQLYVDSEAIPAQTIEARVISDTVLALDYLEKAAAQEESWKNIVRGPNKPLADGIRMHQQQYHDQAFAYHARATGIYDRLETETYDSVYRDAWNGFQQFKKTYGGEQHDVERLAYRKELVGRFAALVALAAEYDQAKLPTMEGRITPYPKYLGEHTEDSREDTLTVREKLIGLRDDKRAGFLPTTHREKVALEMLDYLDNPEYPNGITDRLDQIYAGQKNVPFRRNQKNVVKSRKLVQELGTRPAIDLSPEETEELAWARDFVPEDLESMKQEGELLAEDSVRSIIHEWGDYAANAAYSLSTNILIKQLLGKTENPNLNLWQFIDDYKVFSIDVMPILRYAVLHEFREKGSLPDPIYDPLRTREIRPANVPNKNKIVTDVFLLPADREHLGPQFEYMKSIMTVGDMRQRIDDVIEDSARRSSFYISRLSDVPEDSRYYNHARNALRAIA